MLKYSRIISYINRMCQYHSFSEFKENLKTIRNTDRRILIYLICHLNTNKSVEVLQLEMANKLGCSPKTIERGIDRLSKLGTISKYRRFKAAGLYTIDPYLKDIYYLKQLLDIFPELSGLIYQLDNVCHSSSSILTSIRSRGRKRSDQKNKVFKLYSSLGALITGRLGEWQMQH